MQDEPTPLASINMADYGFDISDLIQFNGQPAEKPGKEKSDLSEAPFTIQSPT